MMQTLKSIAKRLAITPMIVISMFLFIILNTMPVLAADCASQASSTTGRAIIEPVGLPQVGCGSSVDFVTRIIRFVFAFLGAISVIFIAIGGVRYSLSGGDSNSTASAKKTILYAVVGLVIGVSVFVITGFVISLL